MKTCENCNHEEVCGYKAETGKCCNHWQEHIDHIIKTQPRWTILKSNEDIDKLRLEYANYCENYVNCETCKYNESNQLTSAECFAEWLKEEVEV